MNKVSKPPHKTEQKSNFLDLAKTEEISKTTRSLQIIWNDIPPEGKKLASAVARTQNDKKNKNIPTVAKVSKINTI